MGTKSTDILAEAITRLKRQPKGTREMLANWAKRAAPPLTTALWDLVFAGTFRIGDDKANRAKGPELCAALLLHLDSLPWTQTWRGEPLEKSGSPYAAALVRRRAETKAA